MKNKIFIVILFLSFLCIGQSIYSMQSMRTFTKLTSALIKSSKNFNLLKTARFLPKKTNSDSCSLIKRDFSSNKNNQILKIASLKKECTSLKKLDDQNFSGITPLMRQILLGNEKKAAELINMGADVNIQDYYKFTALMYAARKGHVNIVRILMNYQADPTITNCLGRKALDIAMAYRYLDIVDILITESNLPLADLIGNEFKLKYLENCGIRTDKIYDKSSLNEEDYKFICQLY